MSPVTIRHVCFAYRVEADDPVRPGQTILVERKAWQGETLDIPLEEDYERGLRFGAFVTPDTPPARDVQPTPEVVATITAEPPSPEPDEIEESSVSDMSDEELVEWIQRDHPNVRTVVDAAEGDLDQAKRLLKAEDRATGGDSRAGVIKGLTHIINNG